MDQRWKPKNT